MGVTQLLATNHLEHILLPGTEVQSRRNETFVKVFSQLRHLDTEAGGGPPEEPRSGLLTNPVPNETLTFVDEHNIVACSVAVATAGVPHLSGNVYQTSTLRTSFSASLGAAAAASGGREFPADLFGPVPVGTAAAASLNETINTLQASVRGSPLIMTITCVTRDGEFGAGAKPHLGEEEP